MAKTTRNENPREKRVARLPLIDPETTSGDIRASFDRMPVKLNIFRVMAHAETNMIPAMRLGNSILHRQKLSAVNRELLILQVAQLDDGAFNDAERALLSFSKEVVENVRVPDKVFARMRDHYTPQEIVETILAIG